MSSRGELRAFQVVTGLVLLIPLVVGSLGAFGGLEGMARLFDVRGEITVPSSLRNSLRAISLMFVGYVPLVLWSLRALPERAGAFRIAVAFAFLAGFARLTGWLSEGYPGAVPAVFMGMELGLMPVLLLWHRRLAFRAPARSSR